MWTVDLDKLLVEWEETLKEHAAVQNLTKRKPKKNAVLKTRKSIGARGNQSDDDFKPIKAPAPKKKAPVKTKEEDDAPRPPKPAPPKRKAAASKATKPKVESDAESDIELYDDDEPPKKQTIAVDSEPEVVPQGKGKGRAAPKTIAVDSEPEVVPQGKGKGRAAPKKMRSVIDRASPLTLLTIL